MIISRFAHCFSSVLVARWASLLLITSGMLQAKAQSSSKSLRLFTGSTPRCEGPCTFFYLSTGYAWATRTSITTITITEGDSILPETITVAPTTGNPDDTWIISLTTVSKGQIGFSGAGQPSYGDASVTPEYTTTFTLTRSLGDVQRYDGFFTITPPTAADSTSKTCMNQYGAADYCCNAGYTTNFNLSYSGVFVTNGPMNYFPSIPGLNIGNCVTVKLGGIPMLKESVTMLTTYRTVSRLAAQSDVGSASPASSISSGATATSKSVTSSSFTAAPSSEPDTSIALETVALSSSMTTTLSEAPMPTVGPTTGVMIISFPDNSSVITSMFTGVPETATLTLSGVNSRNVTFTSTSTYTYLTYINSTTSARPTLTAAAPTKSSANERYWLSSAVMAYLLMGFLVLVVGVW